MAQPRTPGPIRLRRHAPRCLCPDCRVAKHGGSPPPQTPEDGMAVTTPEQGQPFTTRRI